VSDPVRPQRHLGLHHVAVYVRDLAAARRFWVDLLGFRVEWEPDADNLYLTSGSDNLAVHRLSAGEPAPTQRLDHLGVLCRDPAEVDAWHAWLVANQVRILTAPRRHRDGAYSFYCQDPEGIRVQVIHHPPITAPLRLAQGGAA
jgi:catechol 2,3-dioxygenase-like lactoylglutathione lyase family enzyme